ncbi:MAG: HAMP domain-containing protein [Deltaproteobacteria bacterium]|jgi:two-component system phosphate regulon sensor histidine kinase PhoR|nr:MAG: HAMP domain-containing protein [Deltaproteobacteria bacterium]
MSNLKIVWKLFLTQTSLIIISLLTIGIYAGISLKEHYLEQLVPQLTTNATLIRDIVAKELIDGKSDTIDFLTKRLGSKIHMRATIVDSGGTVLGDSEKDPTKMGNHLDRPEIREALRGKVGKSIRYSETLKTEMMYLALPVEIKYRIIGAVRVSLPLSKVEKMGGHIYEVIVWGAIIAALLSLGIGFILARRMGKPLIQMTMAARKMARGDFSELIRTDSKDEIGDLARSFNTMSIELQNKIETLTKQIRERQAILSGMIEGVIAINQDRRVILINSAAEEILNIPPGRALGRFHWEVIRHTRLNPLFQEVLETGAQKMEEIILHYGGERILRVQTAAIPGEGGTPWAMVAVFHDITQIRDLERVRKEFVANVSHELRTPLTSIKGFVETLRNGAVSDPEKSLRFLEIIEKHTERLNRLITDLLNLSQIESGKTEANNLKPVNLVDVVSRVISNFREIADQKGQKIKMNIPSVLPHVLADKERIETVMENLLDNAVKYTPNNGEVTVSAFEKDDGVQVEVADTGIGIPPKDIPRIFERFYRVDKARSRELGGTGLGLSIVKHIIETHGGKVRAESEAGKGSRFIFNLPKSPLL